MNWLTALFSGGDAVKVVGDTIENVFTNNDAREKALETLKAQTDYDYKIAVLDAGAMSGQVDINKVEAASTTSFVNSWRPFIGWICGFALAYAAIFEPLARFTAKVWFDYEGEFPVINTDITMQILLGMLGLGGMRSFEKIKGVAK